MPTKPSSSGMASSSITATGVCDETVTQDRLSQHVAEFAPLADDWFGGGGGRSRDAAVRRVRRLHLRRPRDHQCPEDRPSDGLQGGLFSPRRWKSVSVRNRRLPGG